MKVHQNQILTIGFLLAMACTSLQGHAQSNGDVTFNSSEQIFDVMAALNVAGYDTGLFVQTGDNTRLEVRNYLSKENVPVAAQLRSFYATHRLSDPGKDFEQWITLALMLGSPPKFQFKIPALDLPPAASDLKGFVPLLRTFYRQASLDDLYARLQPRYEDFIRRYSSRVRREIVLSDAYLRFPSGSYLGRSYHIYVCLLGAPNQAQARIYGDTYYLVVTPSAHFPLKRIRYQYLHFLLDPLAVKYAGELHQKASLEAVARRAPALGSDFKNDFSFLATECLIHAVELRMDKSADAPKQANGDLAQGLILTPYFYGALATYEKQPTPMSDYYLQMIQGIEVHKLEKQFTTVKFAPAKPAAQAAPPPLSAKDQLLNRGDNFIYSGEYDQAKVAFEQVLKQYDSNSTRAMYGLAVVASNSREPDIAVKYFKKTLASTHNLRMITWSHIYLGRIYDLEGERQKALEQYRAASVTAGNFPEALSAVDNGLRHPYGSSAQ